MADDEFTCDLFRFLQLLCEGHNNGELPEIYTYDFENDTRDLTATKNFYCHLTFVLRREVKTMNAV